MAGPWLALLRADPDAAKHGRRARPAARVAVLPQRLTRAGFRGPAPGAIGPTHETDTNIPLKQLRNYDGDELVFNGSDPNTYAVCETAEQLEAAFAAASAKEDR